MTELHHHIGLYLQYGIEYLYFYRDSKELGLSEFTKKSKEHHKKIKIHNEEYESIMKWILNDIDDEEMKEYN